MTTASPLRDNAAPRAFEHIVQALEGLAFGTVEITVHHGRIVQIERREKLRIPERGAAAAGATEADSTT